MGVKIDQNMVISDMPVGHKQFTEIARELSKEQLKLLILDEPTAVLTEKEAEALLQSIRSMAAQGHLRDLHHPPAAGRSCPSATRSSSCGTAMWSRTARPRDHRCA